MYAKYFKRLLDFILALVAIIVLSPVLLITAILVRTKLGSPVIFKQERPGKDEKIFTMYKFRSMTDERGVDGELLPDEDRLPRFGKLLRATSLDELPELWNILRGEMSIVGPRPQLVRDLVFMNKNETKRHTVLPGLTGLAQIKGRNNISWENKFEYDLEYIENISFLRDFSIVILTIKSIFKQEDVSTDGMETAEDYGDYLLRMNKINNSIYEEKIKEAKKLLKIKTEG